MSDENKELNGTEEAVEEAVEEAAAEAVEEAAEETQEPDAALAEELEQLRDTFQATLDETAAAADDPAIQELETGEEEPEEDEDGETSDVYPVMKKGKKNDGKHKKGKIIGIILGILAVLIIGVLLSYVVLTVKNPNTTTYLSNIASADTAEDYDAKISAYKAAINCCEGEGAVVEAMKSAATDKMLELMYKEKGLSEALGYIDENFDENAIAASSSGIIRKLTGLRDSVKDVAVGLVPAMLNAADEKGEVDEKTALASLNIPQELNEILEPVVKDIREGVKASAEAESISDFSAAGNSFLTAHNTLSGYGADADALGQSISAALYNKGYIYEGLYIGANLLSSDESTYSEEFAAVKKDAADFEKLGVSVYSLAEKLTKKDAKPTVEACAKLAAQETKLEGAKLDFLTQVIFEAAKALGAYKEKDITSASEACTMALSAEKVVGIDDAQLNFLYIKVLYAYNVSSAYSMAESVMTDEVIAKLTDKQKEEYEEMQLAFDALAGSSEIFGTYYQSYYQSGTPIDFKEASKALDDYLTDSSNRFDKGFVDYCKYFAKSCSSDPEGAIDYLLKAKKEIPEFVGFFAYNISEYYLENDETEKATEIADEVLAINKTDAYSLSVKAFSERKNGKIDEALKLASAGADASSEINYCAYEAAVDYLLKEDLTKAAEYAKKYYSSVSSSYNATYKDLVSASELLTIIAGLYKENDDLKKELTDLTTEIESMYSYYQFTHLQDTVDVNEGKKTVKDIFASGSCCFDFEATVAEETTAADAPSETVPAVVAE